jgi:hypothetical protein
MDTSANTIIANTIGAGAASIHIHNVNARYTALGVVAAGANNTVGTNANFEFSQTGGGGLLVNKVFTTDGNISIDSNGAVGSPGIRVDFSVADGGLGGIHGGDAGADGDGRVVLATDAGGMVLGSVLSDDVIDRLTSGTFQAGITITADLGDITIDMVSDRPDVDVDINSTNGYIDELVESGHGQDAGIDIMGNYVLMRSAIGIGKKYQLEIDAVTLDAETSSSSGDVWIDESNDVVVHDITTVDGHITITAGGRIVVTNIDARGIGKDVVITSHNSAGTDGSIYMESVRADDDITVTTTAGAAPSDIHVGVVGDAGTDDVTMTANGGSILELDDPTGAILGVPRPADATTDITGDLLTLTADNGIGGAGELDIETNVTTLIADVRDAGDIYLTELDGAGNGINLQSVDTNNGNITLITNGGAHEPEDETLVTYVISDSGVVDGGHDISITADTGDMTIEYVESDSDIALEATLGSITEINRPTNPADADPDIVSNDTVAGKLTITARDEIGDTGEEDIETTVAVLDASSTNAGSIYLTETDAIELLDVDTANGAINIVAGGAIIATDVVSTTDTDANDINLTATTGDITLGVVTAGAGVAADVTLTATAGSINEIGAGDAAVDITGDVLTLTAAGDIGGAGELDIETTANSLIAASTVAGDIFITETNAITLTSITTVASDVTVVSGGDMTVTLIDAGGDGDVSLTTTAGDIIMSGDITALDNTVTLTSAADITDTTSAATDISAADLIISAPNGAVGAAGANNELDTDVDTITASVRDDVYILEENAVTLASIVTTAGLIDVKAGGTITTDIVTANGGYGVNLDATDGDILDLPGGLITGTARSELRAGGIIGTTIDPVDVNIDGELWVWAGSQVDGVSVNLQGTVNGGAATERVEIFEPTPPGLVLLNNHLMGGGNYGSGSPNGSILSRGYGAISLALMDMYYPFYDKALHPWSYKMSLPWVLSEGAKIDADFLSDPPATIDISQLNINAITPLQTGLAAPSANYYVIGQVK